MELWDMHGRGRSRPVAIANGTLPCAVTHRKEANSMCCSGRTCACALLQRKEATSRCWSGRTRTAARGNKRPCSAAASEDELEGNLGVGTQQQLPRRCVTCSAAASAICAAAITTRTTKPRTTRGRMTMPARREMRRPVRRSHSSASVPSEGSTFEGCYVFINSVIIYSLTSQTPPSTASSHS